MTIAVGLFALLTAAIGLILLRTARQARVSKPTQKSSAKRTVPHDAPPTAAPTREETAAPAPPAPAEPAAPPSSKPKEKRVTPAEAIAREREERLLKGLEKTRVGLAARFKGLFKIGRPVDEAFLDELEEQMIGSDMGVEGVMKIVEDVREMYKSKQIESQEGIRDYIKDEMVKTMSEGGIGLTFAPTTPTVILVAGVNGSGKTTSIAKLANLLVQEGKKVILAASDTFRAAAVEQLDIWSQRIGADIVKHQTGADPGAVTFDALDAAIARGADVLIVDTAGRLHTQQNLMKELGKIERVIKKKVPDGPHEVLLILDATTGQNAISQGKLFAEVIGVTGIFLTKLDGTAKGGIVVGLKNQLDLPVKFVGLGESPDDIEPFSPRKFVDAMFE